MPGSFLTGSFLTDAQGGEGRGGLLGKWLQAGQAAGFSRNLHRDLAMHDWHGWHRRQAPLHPAPAPAGPGCPREVSTWSRGNWLVGNLGSTSLLLRQHRHQHLQRGECMRGGMVHKGERHVQIYACMHGAVWIGGGGRARSKRARASTANPPADQPGTLRVSLKLAGGQPASRRRSQPAAAPAAAGCCGLYTMLPPTPPHSSCQ